MIALMTDLEPQHALTKRSRGAVCRLQDMPETEVSKRKKPPACDYCKARRVLCHPQPDGPCPRCVEKGVNCTTTPVVRRKRRTKAELLASASQPAEERYETSSPSGSSEQAASSASLVPLSILKEDSAAVILRSWNTLSGDPLPVPPCCELPAAVVEDLFETFRNSPNDSHPLINLSKLEESLRLSSWDLTCLQSQDRVLAYSIITVASVFSKNPFILGQAELNAEHSDFFTSPAPLKLPIVPDLRPYGQLREPLVRQLWAETIWLANHEGITTNPSKENAASCWLLGHLSHMFSGNRASAYTSAYIHHIRFLAEDGSLSITDEAEMLRFCGYMIGDAFGALFSGKSIPFTRNDERLIVPIQFEPLEQLIRSVHAKTWSVSDVFLSLPAFAHHYIRLARETSENLTGVVARRQPLDECFLITHFASLDLFHSLLTAELDQISRLLQQLPSHEAQWRLFYLRVISTGFVLSWGSLVFAVYELLQDRISECQVFHPSSDGSSSSSHGPSSLGSASSKATVEWNHERIQMHLRRARTLTAKAAVEICELLRDTPSAERLVAHPGDLSRWARFLMEEENVVGITRIQYSRTLECFRDAIQVLGFFCADRTDIVERINDRLALYFVDDMLLQIDQSMGYSMTAQDLVTGVGREVERILM
ncbi:hypothetical protein GYMLUDRAFT_491370, partial [Collybiopsis luxurians FD-317 M1]